MFAAAEEYNVDLIYGPLINEICISNVPIDVLYNLKAELEEN
jgi:hypothetical protein